MNYLYLVLFCLVGYLLGSVVFASVIVKKVKGKDIRKLGSGNTGATNVKRNFSMKLALCVALLDIFKCYLVQFVFNLLVFNVLKVDQSDIFYFFLYFPGMCCILGHCYPVMYVSCLIFKKENAAKHTGGKGISTIGALFLVVDPILAGICLVIWFLQIVIVKYVSLAGIVTTLVAIGLFFIGKLHVYYPDWSGTITNWDSIDTNIFYGSLITFIYCFLMATWRHKANLVRLFNGTEPKAFSKKKESKS